MIGDGMDCTHCGKPMKDHPMMSCVGGYENDDEVSDEDRKRFEAAPVSDKDEK